MENQGSELSENSGDFLHWIHSRFQYVYKDNPKQTYMVRLKKLAEELEKEEVEQMQPTVPNIDVSKVKPYEIRTTVFKGDELQESVRSYFKSDYPNIIFWDAVIITGKKWSNLERVVALHDEDGCELQACTISPKST